MRWAPYFLFGGVELFGGVDLVAGLIVQQLSQADRRRGGKNVTVMLYSLGLPAGYRTAMSVQHLDAWVI